MKAKHYGFNLGDWVKHSKLQIVQEGPFVVKQKCSAVNYLIDISEGRHKRFVGSFISCVTEMRQFLHELLESRGKE